MSKVALVTGGSGGLGAAICHRLAQVGYRVLFTYHANQQAADNVLTSLSGEGHCAYPLDVTDSAAITALAEHIKEEVGSLKLLVNCAGITQFIKHQDLHGLTDALFDRILSVNIRAPFAMVRALTPLLSASGQGCIVNITSLAAQTATGSNIAYCASKAALANMTQSLARALAPNIRVLAVAPGLVDTDFVKGLDPQWRNQQEQYTPLKRLACADEVAKAVVVAAEQMTCSTGITLSVDGGRSLGV